MSFKAELEALIANANSSLEDLEAVLRRAHSQSGHTSTPNQANGEVREIQTQLETIRNRILTPLLQIQERYRHDQERLYDLEGELKLDLENVRQCAIDYFIKGDYRECTRLLAFLAKVQPHDENLGNLLNLSRQKQLENEGNGDGAGVDEQFNSASSTSEPQETLETHAQSNQEIPQRTVNSLEPPLRRSAGKLDGPPTQCQSDPTAQSETIEPQILAEIELKTAAHINETYRISTNSSKPRALVWVAVAGFLLAVTLGWIAWYRQEVAGPFSFFSSSPEGEKMGLPKDPLADLRQQAQALFDAGNLPEAERVCDLILSKQPLNSFAAALKDQIGGSLAGHNIQPEVLPSAKAEQLPETPAQPFSEAQSARVQIKNELVGSGAGLRESMPTYRGLDSKQDSKVLNPIEQRHDTEPNSVTNQPAPVAPASVAPVTSVATSVTRAPQISSDALVQLNLKLQAKDFDQARLLLERLESEAPGNPELKIARERLRVEASKQQSLAVSWIEKAEVAWIAGRYVTPPDDNVLVYCNLSLKADPKNQRAANLKKEIVQRAVAQAKDWIQRGKFDAARMSYASMDYLAAGDNSFPYSKPEIKRELEKLAFKTYPMTHDHKLGSCSGTLKFNAYAVSYIPTGDSGDGFTESLNSIVINEEGQRLRIAYRNKTLRLRSEQGNAVQSVYQQLMSRMTDDKSILATRDKDVRQP